MWTQSLAAVALGWYIFILFVVTIGTLQLYRHYTSPSPTPISPKLPLSAVPHVTIIRPVKGLEPYLYECLASTFSQTYPSFKLTIYFCLPSRSDPSFPILIKLLADFPSFDARVFLEDEGPNLLAQDGKEHNLGPNPKIRNMSRAYREAKGDIIWIADCNVWLSASVTGLMVDLLCGFSRDPNKPKKKYKFVHQLPLAVDVSHLSPPAPSQPDLKPPRGPPSSVLSRAGGLLEETFLSTSHAKFYTAISTVAVAPCTVGKSNMFRRSHLDALTQPPLAPSPSAFSSPSQSPGIDFFSHNICEDHLIGDLLWHRPIPSSVLVAAALEGLSPSPPKPASRPEPQKIKWANHALLPSPPCIQPLSSLSLPTYLARRTRWLRVRKFTVPAATLVEPGTESLATTSMGAWGFTTLRWSKEAFGIGGTWGEFWGLWIVGMVAWVVLDWFIWGLLHVWPGMGGRVASPEGKEDREGTPEFVGSGIRRRKRGGVWRWLAAWVGREVLALPVWAWAVLGGRRVVWRGRMFSVGVDMRVREVFPRDKGRVKRID